MHIENCQYRRDELAGIVVNSESTGRIDRMIVTLDSYFKESYIFNKIYINFA